MYAPVAPRAREVIADLVARGQYHFTSIPWGQRLGYLLDHVGAGDKAVLLREHVRKRARNFAKLLPAASAEGATRSSDWRLYVNADIETEA